MHVAFIEDTHINGGTQIWISMIPFTDEPQYLFERTDITVLPSLRKEGLPNVLLESMAMRVPVVASRLGGVQEALIPGETGYLVDPGDIGQLASVILQLATDRAAAKGESGRIKQVTRDDRV